MDKQNLSPQNDEILKIKSELETCQNKAEEYLNGWKRAKADYINFKKETEKEKLELAKFANAALIIQLLPIVNNFKRAFEYSPEKIDDEKIKNCFIGFGHIYEQLIELFKKMGIEEIKTVGEKFNPELHEALEGEESEIVSEEEDKTETKNKEQIIIKEVSAGYTMYGQVIMPAKVVIS